MKKAAAISVVAFLSVFVYASQPQPVDQVNVGVAGEANRFSMTRGESRCISADGRFVIFYSEGDNLIRGDTNRNPDIFLKDNFNGKIERVNVDNSGAQTPQGDWSSDPAISGDGTVVAFISMAALVPNVFNGTYEVYVRDLKTQHTELVSVNNMSGAQANMVSDLPSLSRDGQVVAFESWAFNLVPNDTNNTLDVFVYDRPTGMTERISLDSQGNQGNKSSAGASISSDGRYVVFYSNATNLVPNDTNNVGDVFIRDRLFGTTARVSTDSFGNQANGPSLNATFSADGNWVVFESYASNLVPNDLNNAKDVFIKNLITGATELVSTGPFGQGNSDSYLPSVTQHGRYVIFSSAATNLIANDTNNQTDVFVKDRLTGTVSRLSEGPNGLEANSYSASRGTDALGLHVLFDSGATNLVPNDLNNTSDVFIRNRKHDPGFLPDK